MQLRNNLPAIIAALEDAERMRAALKTVLPSYDAAIRTLAAEQMHDLAEQMPPLTSQITLPTERG